METERRKQPDASRSKIVKAQVNFIVSTIDEANWQKNSEELKKLEEESSQVYLHFLRKLITTNANVIFGTSQRPDSNPITRRILIEEIKTMVKKPSSTYRFKDAITDGEDAVFKDFDFERFIENLGLDPLERSVLAVSLLDSWKMDLRQKGIDTIADSSYDLLVILRDPSKHADLPDEDLYEFLKKYLVDHKSFSIFNSSQEEAICQAVRSRYANSFMPSNTKELITKLDRARTAEQDRASSLAQIVERSGPGGCSSLPTFLEILGRKGLEGGNNPERLGEPDIALMLAMMTTTLYDEKDDRRETRRWNGEIIGNAISLVLPDLDWTTIFAHISRQIVISDPERFSFVLDTFHAAGQDSSFSLRTLLDSPLLPFRFAMLRLLSRLPPHIYNVLERSEQLILAPSDFSTSANALKERVQFFASQNWNSLDLVATAFALDAENEDIGQKQFVHDEMRRVPELFFLGVIQFPEPWAGTMGYLAAEGFSLFFSNRGSYQLVFHRLNQVNPDFLRQKFVEAHAENAVNIGNILNFAVELKIVPDLLKMRPYSFVLDLATVYSRREFLNLKKWLEEMLEEGEEEFFAACLDFLQTKAKAELDLQQKPNIPMTQIGLKLIAVVTFLRVLHSHHSTVSPEARSTHFQVQNLVVRAYPYLVFLEEDNDEFFEGIRDGMSLPREIEKEIENIFTQMYDRKLTVESVFSTLQQFRKSSDPRQRDIYAAFVHSLLDEFRFFGSYYPPNALAVTAVVFGTMINLHFLEYIPLSIALRDVMEAIKDEPLSKMFAFGVQAITMFKERAKDFPQYFNNILQLQHFVQSQPELAQEIRSNLAIQNGEYGSSNQSQSDSTITALASRSSPMHTHPRFTSVSVSTTPPDGLEWEEPPMDIRDKILFLINNLTKVNAEQKLKEFKELFTESMYCWFADYLVSGRVYNEPNNHELYFKFLDLIGSKKLMRQVLHQTYRSCIRLLNTEETITSATERQYLKNLAQWLGGLTVARDNPVLHKNISFKDLLMEGYETQRLIVVIPFTCKVIEQCKNSQVFKPGNPWLNGIHRLLSEFYQYAELKLNLKFEIEMSCRALDLDIKEIEPSMILKERADRLAEEEDRIQREAVAAQQQLALAAQRAGELERYDEQVYEQQQRQLLAQQQVQQAVHQRTENMLSSLLKDLPKNLRVRDLFASHGGLKRLLAIAIDNAVRDVYAPIVERASNIVSVTTSALVAKDFGSEENERNIRQAALIMVQNLAGSLATATCKDQMRNAMIMHIRNLMIQNGYREEQLPENDILMLVGENLDVAAAVVDKTASDRATLEVNDAVETLLAQRKMFRENRPDQAFIDPRTHEWATSLPAPLSLSPGGLSAVQLKVYENFSLIPRTATAAVALYGNDDGTRARLGNDAKNAVNVPVQATPSVNDEIRGRLQAFLADLENEIRSADFDSFSAIPPDHEIKSMTTRLIEQVAALPQREEAYSYCAQRVLWMLYNNAEVPFARNCCVAVLQRITDNSPRAEHEVIKWLYTLDNDRKFNIPITISLIQKGIINPAELDLKLAKLIQDGNKAATEFTANLIREAVLVPKHPYAERDDFSTSLQIFEKILRETPPLVPTSVRTLWDMLRGKLSVETVVEPSDEVLATNHLYVQVFAQWVTSLDDPTARRQQHVAFVWQLHERGILEDNDMSSSFYLVSLQMSIGQFYRHSIQGRAGPDAYKAVDAWVQLVLLIVEYHEDSEIGSPNQAKLVYLAKILALVILVFSHSYEDLKDEFNQLPFFRLLGTLLTLLDERGQTFRPIQSEILGLIGETLLTLQPTHFPAFTFAWLNLVSHKHFMSKLLMIHDNKGWPTFTHLLAALLRFMDPYLRISPLSESVKGLFKGLMRVLLVLLHDFPDYLCANYVNFCNLIPPRCVQLRNLILSAFPRTMHLPDPFTPNLQIDHLPEIRDIPSLTFDAKGILEAVNLKEPLDRYLSENLPSDFPEVLLENLRVKTYQNGLVNGHEAHEEYDVELLSAFVLYLGISATKDVSPTSPEAGAPIFEGAPPYTDFLANFAHIMDDRGRYELFSSMANQLRYPNIHTQYFSRALLAVFSHEISDARSKEQITRILLERLICNRPHPWGLLITFTELLKNGVYHFWGQSFVKVAPEIERLFHSLYTHINGTI